LGCYATGFTYTVHTVNRNAFQHSPEIGSVTHYISCCYYFICFRQ